MDKKKLIRVGAGILALITLILLSLWLGGVLDSTPAPLPSTRDNKSAKLDLRLPNASKMNKDVIKRLQKRVSKQEQGDASSSESQEEVPFEEVTPVVSKKTRPAAKKAASVKKVTTGQSAPPINPPTLSAKTLPEETSENGTPPIHKPKHSVINWIPDPSKLQLSLFTEYYYKFVDFIRRLTAAESADSFGKIAHDMVDSIFNDFREMGINNPEFAKALELDQLMKKLGITS